MEIYKDLSSPVNQKFEKLLNSQLSKNKIEEGKIIEGKVTKITNKYIFLFIPGLKSEPVIDVNEMKMLGSSNDIKEGDSISVLLEKIEDKNLDDTKFENLKENEEFILSVTDKGFGKRSSAFEYRKTKRGGLGIANMQLSNRNGSQVVASFPINNSDQLVLVTDKGKLIRCPVNDVRIGGRQTQGVTLFNVSDEEKVVSVAKLEEND